MSTKNKYFYRGIIRSLLASVVMVASIFAATTAYSETPESGLVYFLALIGLLAVGHLGRGLYYMIPFRNGSPWNGEMRWKATVFEYSAGIVLILGLSLIFTPLSEVLDYLWLGLIVVAAICLFFFFGTISAKRPHAPVTEDFFDKLLAKVSASLDA